MAKGGGKKYGAGVLVIVGLVAVVLGVVFGPKLLEMTNKEGA